MKSLEEWCYLGVQSVLEAVVFNSIDVFIVFIGI